MSAYAIAHLRSVQMGAEIGRYLEQIDATLKPYGGRFLVHGAQADVREDEFAGDLIVIAFPDRESATGWYESDAYQEILPLRPEMRTGGRYRRRGRGRPSRNRCAPRMGTAGVVREWQLSRAMVISARVDEMPRRQVSIRLPRHYRAEQAGCSFSSCCEPAVSSSSARSRRETRSMP